MVSSQITFTLGAQLIAAFAKAWIAAPAAYAFVADGDYARLRAELPMQAIARDTRYVFVRKP